MPAPSFRALCSAMDAAGVECRVTLEGERHGLRLVDHHAPRALQVPVRRGFDREAGVLCAALVFAADVPGCTGEAVTLARQWPELVALGRDHATVTTTGPFHDRCQLRPARTTLPS